MINYYFSQIKYEANQAKDNFESFQLMIKEQPGPTKTLGKTRLTEASIIAKQGYIPENQHLNRFVCKKGSNVELTFKSKACARAIKAIIDFHQNNIEFASSALCDLPPTDTHNYAKEISTPDTEIASTILESIYIGNNKKFIFFISGKNKKM